MANDVDGDGRLELVICAGADIYMFKSSQDNRYYLWYLKRENARDGIAFYDFNGDGRKDMIVGKTIYVDPPGYFQSFADIYVQTSLVSVSSEPPFALRPKGMSLYANFPNPFNPSTTIEFFLPSKKYTVVTIYDITGKAVDVILNEFLGAGRHSVTWSAVGTSSGIYFCRLQAGSTTLTRKLILIH